MIRTTKVIVMLATPVPKHYRTMCTLLLINLLIFPLYHYIGIFFFSVEEVSISQKENQFPASNHVKTPVAVCTFVHYWRREASFLLSIVSKRASYSSLAIYQFIHLDIIENALMWDTWETNQLPWYENVRKICCLLKVWLPCIIAN